MPVAQEVVLAGKFLRESLIQYEATVDEPIYPELWAYEGQYHNAVADLRLGAQGFNSARMDYTGRAVNYGGKATTIPLANYGIEMDSYKTIKGILAADWTWEELRAQEMAQTNPYLPVSNVVQNYRNAVDRGLREWMHIRAIFGDPAASFNGLLTNPFVEVIAVSAGANGITGTGATAATAYDWLLQEASNFRKDSRLTSSATAVLTSEDVALRLSRRFVDVASAGTPMDMLTAGASAQFAGIFRVNEMSGAIVRDPQMGNRTSINGVTINATDDLLLMFDANVAVNMVRHFADIEYLPVGLLDSQMEYRLIGVCATSEVIYKQPFKCRLYVLRK